MSPSVLRAIAAALVAVAVVINAIASGHVDTTQLIDAVAALGAVVALIEAAIKSHAAEPAVIAHDATPASSPGTVGQP